MPTIFISGIDTDAGKSYCTAWLAMHLASQDMSVVTQKFVQTGNDPNDISEDIIMHRRLTGTPLMNVDLDHTTSPLIYSHPCSPQLAARIDGNPNIPLDKIDQATTRLSTLFDAVLIEGAGGLMVPLTDEFFTIDYIASRQLPLALVVHGGLGSINHAILSFEAIKARGICLHSILYNTHFDTDPYIAADTRAFIARYAEKHFPGTPIFDVPTMNAKTD